MLSSYSLGQVIFEYFKWHYGRGFNEFVEITRNFLLFLLHFFSFKLLFGTFFSPWKKMGEHYQKEIHIESAISTFIVNLIMRIVGAVSRLAVMLMGIICIVIFIALALASSIIWLLMPMILTSLLLSSFLLIYASI